MADETTFNLKASVDIQVKDAIQIERLEKTIEELSIAAKEANEALKTASDPKKALSALEQAVAGQGSLGRMLGRQSEDLVRMANAFKGFLTGKDNGAAQKQAVEAVRQMALMAQYVEEAQLYLDRGLTDRANESKENARKLQAQLLATLKSKAFAGKENVTNIKYIKDMVEDIGRIDADVMTARQQAITESLKATAKEARMGGALFQKAQSAARQRLAANKPADIADSLSDATSGVFTYLLSLKDLVDQERRKILALGLPSSSVKDLSRTLHDIDDTIKTYFETTQNNLNKLETSLGTLKPQEIPNLGELLSSFQARFAEEIAATAKMMETALPSNINQKINNKQAAAEVKKSGESVSGKLAEGAVFTLPKDYQKAVYGVYSSPDADAAEAELLARIDKLKSTKTSALEEAVKTQLLRTSKGLTSVYTADRDLQTHVADLIGSNNDQFAIDTLKTMAQLSRMREKVALLRNVKNDPIMSERADEVSRNISTVVDNWMKVATDSKQLGKASYTSIGNYFKALASSGSDMKAVREKFEAGVKRGLDTVGTSEGYALEVAKAKQAKETKTAVESPTATENVDPKLVQAIIDLQDAIRSKLKKIRSSITSETTKVSGITIEDIEPLVKAVEQAAAGSKAPAASAELLVKLQELDKSLTSYLDTISGSIETLATSLPTPKFDGTKIKSALEALYTQISSTIETAIGSMAVPADAPKVNASSTMTPEHMADVVATTATYSKEYGEAKRDRSRIVSELKSKKNKLANLEEKDTDELGEKALERHEEKVADLESEIDEGNAELERAIEEERRLRRGLRTLAKGKIPEEVLTQRSVDKFLADRKEALTEKPGESADAAALRQKIRDIEAANEKRMERIHKREGFIRNIDEKLSSPYLPEADRPGLVDIRKIHVAGLEDITKDGEKSLARRSEYMSQLLGRKVETMNFYRSDYLPELPKESVEPAKPAETAIKPINLKAVMEEIQSAINSNLETFRKELETQATQVADFKPDVAKINLNAALDKLQSELNTSLSSIQQATKGLELARPEVPSFIKDKTGVLRPIVEGTPAEKTPTVNLSKVFGEIQSAINSNLETFRKELETQASNVKDFKPDVTKLNLNAILDRLQSELNTSLATIQKAVTEAELKRVQKQDFIKDKTGVLRPVTENIPADAASAAQVRDMLISIRKNITRNVLLSLDQLNVAVLSIDETHPQIPFIRDEIINITRKIFEHMLEDLRKFDASIVMPESSPLTVQQSIAKIVETKQTIVSQLNTEFSTIATALKELDITTPTKELLNVLNKIVTRRKDIRTQLRDELRSYSEIMAALDVKEVPEGLLEKARTLKTARQNLHDVIRRELTSITTALETAAQYFDATLIHNLSKEVSKQAEVLKLAATGETPASATSSTPVMSGPVFVRSADETIRGSAEFTRLAEIVAKRENYEKIGKVTMTGELEAEAFEKTHVKLLNEENLALAECIALQERLNTVTPKEEAIVPPAAPPVPVPVPIAEEYIASASEEMRKLPEFQELEKKVKFRKELEGIHATNPEAETDFEVKRTRLLNAEVEAIARCNLAEEQRLEILSLRKPGGAPKHEGFSGTSEEWQQMTDDEQAFFARRQALSKKFENIVQFNDALEERLKPNVIDQVNPHAASVPSLFSLSGKGEDWLKKNNGRTDGAVDEPVGVYKVDQTAPTVKGTGDLSARGVLDEFFGVTRDGGYKDLVRERLQSRLDDRQIVEGMDDNGIAGVKQQLRVLESFITDSSNSLNTLRERLFKQVFENVPVGSQAKAVSAVIGAIQDKTGDSLEARAKVTHDYFSGEKNNQDIASTIEGITNISRAARLVSVLDESLDLGHLRDLSATRSRIGELKAIRNSPDISHEERANVMQEEARLKDLVLRQEDMRTHVVQTTLSTAFKQLIPEFEAMGGPNAQVPTNLVQNIVGQFEMLSQRLARLSPGLEKESIVTALARTMFSKRADMSTFDLDNPATREEWRNIFGKTGATALTGTTINNINRLQYLMNERLPYLMTRQKEDEIARTSAVRLASQGKPDEYVSGKLSALRGVMGFGDRSYQDLLNDRDFMSNTNNARMLGLYEKFQTAISSNNRVADPLLMTMEAMLAKPIATDARNLLPEEVKSMNVETAQAELARALGGRNEIKVMDTVKRAAILAQKMRSISAKDAYGTEYYGKIENVATSQLGENAKANEALDKLHALGVKGSQAVKNLTLTIADEVNALATDSNIDATKIDEAFTRIRAALTPKFAPGEEGLRGKMLNESLKLQKAMLDSHVPQTTFGALGAMTDVSQLYRYEGGQMVPSDMAQSFLDKGFDMKSIEAFATSTRKYLDEIRKLPTSLRAKMMDKFEGIIDNGIGYGRSGDMLTQEELNKLQGSNNFSSILEQISNLQKITGQNGQRLSTFKAMGNISSAMDNMVVKLYGEVNELQGKDRIDPTQAEAYAKKINALGDRKLKLFDAIKKIGLSPTAQSMLKDVESATESAIKGDDSHLARIRAALPAQTTLTPDDRKNMEVIFGTTRDIATGSRSIQDSLDLDRRYSGSMSNVQSMIRKQMFRGTPVANMDSYNNATKATADLIRLTQQLGKSNEDVFSAIQRAMQGQQAFDARTGESYIKLNKLARSAANNYAKAYDQNQVNTPLIRPDNFLSRDLFHQAYSYTIGMSMYRGMDKAMSYVPRALDYQQKLAELQTLTQQSPITEGQWSSQMMDLSSRYNVDLLDQTEAAYQAISNQVVQAGNAYKYLASTNELANATMSKSSTANNAVSSMLKAYGLNTEYTPQIAGKLFQAVNFGRFRLSDVADNIGQVSVTSHQLGVKDSEMLGALSAMTVQGVGPAESMTLLRNVIMRLAKPTENLQKFFTQLGVSSGEAAVRTYGLVGVMQKLEDYTRGSTDELADMFDRIRSVTGAAALFGSGGEQFRQFVKGIEESGEYYRNAVDIVQSTDAFKTESAWRKMDNDITGFIHGWIKELKTFSQAVTEFPALSMAAMGIGTAGYMVNWSGAAARGRAIRSNAQPTSLVSPTMVDLSWASAQGEGEWKKAYDANRALAKNAGVRTLSNAGLNLTPAEIMAMNPEELRLRINSNRLISNMSAGQLIAPARGTGLWNQMMGDSISDLDGLPPDVKQRYIRRYGSNGLTTRAMFPTVARVGSRGFANSAMDAATGIGGGVAKFLSMDVGKSPLAAAAIGIPAGIMTYEATNWALKKFATNYGETSEAIKKYNQEMQDSAEELYQKYARQEKLFNEYTASTVKLEGIVEGIFANKMGIASGGAYAAVKVFSDANAMQRKLYEQTKELRQELDGLVKENAQEYGALDKMFKDAVNKSTLSKFETPYGSNLVEQVRYYQGEVNKLSPDIAAATATGSRISDELTKAKQAKADAQARLDKASDFVSQYENMSPADKAKNKTNISAAKAEQAAASREVSENLQKQYVLNKEQAKSFEDMQLKLQNYMDYNSKLSDAVLKAQQEQYQIRVKIFDLSMRQKREDLDYYKQVRSAEISDMDLKREAYTTALKTGFRLLRNGENFISYAKQLDMYTARVNAFRGTDIASIAPRAVSNQLERYVVNEQKKLSHESNAREGKELNKQLTLNDLNVTKWQTAIDSNTARIGDLSRALYDFKKEKKFLENDSVVEALIQNASELAKEIQSGKIDTPEAVANLEIRINSLLARAGVMTKDKANLSPQYSQAIAKATEVFTPGLINNMKLATGAMQTVKDMTVNETRLGALLRDSSRKTNDIEAGYRQASATGDTLDALLMSMKFSTPLRPDGGFDFNDEKFRKVYKLDTGVDAPARGAKGWQEYMTHMNKFMYTDLPQLISKAEDKSPTIATAARKQLLQYGPVVSIDDVGVFANKFDKLASVFMQLYARGNQLELVSPSIKNMIVKQMNNNVPFETDSEPGRRRLAGNAFVMARELLERFNSPNDNRKWTGDEIKFFQSFGNYIKANKDILSQLKGTEYEGFATGLENTINFFNAPGVVDDLKKDPIDRVYHSEIKNQANIMRGVRDSKITRDEAIKELGKLSGVSPLMLESLKTNSLLSEQVDLQQQLVDYAKVGLEKDPKKQESMLKNIDAKRFSHGLGPMIDVSAKKNGSGELVEGFNPESMKPDSAIYSAIQNLGGNMATFTGSTPANVFGTPAQLDPSQVKTWNHYNLSNMKVEIHSLKEVAINEGNLAKKLVQVINSQIDRGTSKGIANA